MSDASLRMSGTLTPTKHYGSAQKKTKSRRVLHFGIPKLGQIAFSRDPGDAASLFSQHFLRTNLHATMIDPDGQVLLEENLGAGLVTNVGVLAMAANDIVAGQAKAKEPWNIFALSRWHAWGTKATAAAATDIKLGTYAKPTETECVEGTVTLTASGAGSPKILNVGKLKAESSIAVVEWGLHTSKLLSKGYGTAEKFESVTTTSAKIAAANEFTESTTEVRGLINEILLATEAEEIWGLVTKNTKTVATVPAFYKQSTGGEKAPSGTSAFKVKPVLWDHKEFAAINVESGNEIQFEYSLEVKSSG